MAIGVSNVLCQLRVTELFPDFQTLGVRGGKRLPEPNMVLFEHPRPSICKTSAYPSNAASANAS